MEELKKQEIKPDTKNGEESDIVTLNLRNQMNISVSRKLLTSIPDSSLEAMFSGRHPLEEKDGKFLVDRDPEAFQYLIVYLQNHDIPQNKKLKAELDFWGIS